MEEHLDLDARSCPSRLSGDLRVTIDSATPSLRMNAINFAVFECNARAAGFDEADGAIGRRTPLSKLTPIRLTPTR